VAIRPARAPVQYRTFIALVSAGFRRYSTYRQATVAGLFANVVFGFLRSYVLLAVVGRQAAGYDSAQILTYVWVSQGMIATVGMWGEVGLADRIRTGDVVADLLRPVPPVVSYLATDLGRAGFAALVRFVGPVVVGALAFDLRWPQRPATYPLFVGSVVFATVISFGCRYLAEAAAYWLLDARGPRIVWTLCSNALTGLVFPLTFLPGWAAAVLWTATPFPWLLQAPVDVLVERHPGLGAAALVGGQALWAGALLAGIGYVQRLGTRRLVVQGG
jgi:ABC-2 type transport system permease protein